MQPTTNRLRSILALSVVFLCTSIFAPNLRADPLTVDQNGTAQFTEIQQAIDTSAITGDRISVAPGTYYEAINFNGKAIHLYSTEGPELTTIDADGEFHAIQCVTGEDPNTIIEGFTITGGRANGWESPQDASGGAILNVSASPTIINCIFTENFAMFGGAISNESHANPTIRDCTFTLNSASAGGAIANTIAEPNIIGCSFLSNDASIAGAIFNQFSSIPLIRNSIFTANTASISGGAIDNEFDANPHLINCIFTANSASEGGAIYNSFSSPIIQNCNLIANTADIGGAIANYRISLPQITNCIIRQNSSDQIDSATAIELNHCNIQGGWPGNQNIDNDPCFLQPGHYDSNSLWIEGDYYFLPSSPCVDAGTNSVVPIDSLDIQDKPRITDGDINGTAIVDIGAHEYQFPPLDVNMIFTPRVLNPDSRGRWIKAHFVLPEGFDVNDIDPNTPAVLQPGNFESDHIDVFLNDANLVAVDIAFDRKAFTGANLPAGPIEVTVTGFFENNWSYRGTDTITLKPNKFQNLLRFSSAWLTSGCSRPDFCNGCDLNRDSIVNFEDIQTHFSR